MSGDETKRRIFLAARELFSEKGFAKTTVRDIAGASGQNVALISYHFGSKDGLLGAIVTDFTERFRNRVPPIEENRRVEERVFTVVDLLTDTIREDEATWRIILRLILDNDPGVKEMMRGQIIAIVFSVFGKSPESLGDEIVPGLPFFIGGPALASMVFSNFIFRSVIEEIGGEILNEEFYNKYRDSLKVLFTRGLKGFYGKEGDSYA